MTVKEFLEEAAAKLDFENPDNLPPKTELVANISALYEADTVKMRFDDLVAWAFGASGYMDAEEIRAFCFGVDCGRRAAKRDIGCAGKVKEISGASKAWRGGNR